MPDLKWICPDRPRRKMPMSRSSQNQSASVQIIPDRNCICPYFRAFMSRPSCAPNYIRAFNAKFLVCPCPDHRAFISRFSCVCQNEKNYILCCGAYSLKMKTERVLNFHKSKFLRFIKKFYFKSLFLYD